MREVISRFKIKTIFLVFLILFACDTNIFHSEKKSNPLKNKPPETYLFLFVANDSAIGIDTTASKQVVHWWGEDPDGEVIGYYIQWNYQSEPLWMTAEHDTFYVPIRTDYDEFELRVWAVDNDSLMDPTPARQVFPVFNSYPVISFKNRSNPPAPSGNPNVTAFTFPTRTFMWEARDPDGDETITDIFYALDDTTQWLKLAGTERSITLTGLAPGSHRFFLKARDIAGAESEIISFPDPEDEQTPNNWVVKEPLGDVLLVNDYALDQTNYVTQTYYENLLKNIVGESGYSVWEIGTSKTPVINPENSLPYATADIKANLDYFKKVIWFSHLGRPNLSAAGLSLTKYIAAGGNIFITNGNEEIPDTTWTFTQIDSVFRLNPGGRLLAGVKVLSALSQDSVENTSLNLEVGRLIGNRVSALIPGKDAEVVFRMEADSTASVSVPYKGSPPVGIRYSVGKGKSIYFSLPLNYCDGLGNVEDLLRYILEEEFSQ